MSSECLTQHNNVLLLIVGKSGSGKSTIAAYLNKCHGLKAVESYTTRPPRYDGETGHTFITYQEFLQLKNKVAHTYFDGHYYCATEEQCQDADIYIIDPDGVDTFEKYYNGTKPYKIIYIDTKWYVRLSRMLQRGDNLSSALRRIRHDHNKFKNFEKAPDKVTIQNNDSFNKNPIALNYLADYIYFSFFYKCIIKN